ncbi:hypothetical protein [Croceivirga radicis]|uniref:hypothetical protein n=1 Tax=Croceivirga radicis TaxID=1929488 RepID=UPI000255AECF|nr:hypothetical protein [Croceivirga radicis]
MNNTDIILNAFVNLDISFLDELNNELDFSSDYKLEFIDKMNLLFEEQKKNGVEELVYVMGKCNHCYKGMNNYEFFDKATGKFLFRYVIGQETELSVVVTTCGNRF